MSQMSSILSSQTWKRCPGGQCAICGCRANRHARPNASASPVAAVSVPEMVSFAQRGSSGSVSYTHLTLPTICSV
eukprot:2491043-Rhodomonas_salina.1